MNKSGSSSFLLFSLPWTKYISSFFSFCRYWWYFKKSLLRFPLIFNWKNSSSQTYKAGTHCVTPLTCLPLHLILITVRWTLLFSRVCNWEDLWNKHLCKPPESVMQEVTANGIWTLSTYTVAHGAVQRSRCWICKNNIKKNNNKVTFFFTSKSSTSLLHEFLKAGRCSAPYT